MASFQRLICFETDLGETVYGDLEQEVPTREIEGQEVKVLSGDIYTGFTKTQSTAKIAKLLAPLPPPPIIHCVGLNYLRHAHECSLVIPPNPAIFSKPTDALTGPLDTIPVHPDAQSQLDYEGELAVVIGKDCKNVCAENFADVLLGYAVANDVSARELQLPASVSGGQFSYAKSFDAFCPLGPCIVHPTLIPDPHNLILWTKVNGEERQRSGTDDMIFGVGKVVEWLSRGRTLRRGTVVLLGTPSGVGMFWGKRGEGFLRDGDVVEVGVEGVGSIVNRFRFE